MRRSFSAFSAITVICVFLSQAFAQTQKDIETPPAMPLADQEQLAVIQDAMSIIDRLEVKLKEASIQKRSHCMKSIGIQQFCECIASKSPVGITFSGYVGILAATKSELKYDELSSEEKVIVDNARAARDECVKQANQ